MRPNIIDQDINDDDDRDIVDSQHSNYSENSELETMSELDDPMRKIHSNLIKFLHGEWANLPFKDLKIQQLSGGLSNYLYLCSIPSETVVPDDEPRRVLVRIFGDSLDQEDQSVDNLVFAILAEKGLGPKLHGTFSGGRIEEYIPSVSLTMEDFRKVDLSRRIAKKLAWFHSLQMPVSKDPNGIYNHIVRYVKEMNEPRPWLDCDSDTKKLLQEFAARADFLQELDWLKDTLNKVNSPVVFCHNDVQAGNILKSLNGSDAIQLKLIDFEFSGYGYRAFDIANHFCEWAMDNFYEHRPYFRYIPKKYPNRHEQLVFLNAYREALSTDVSDECILQEVEYFTLLSHFMWALWSASRVGISKINFDYMTYAQCRLDLYFDLKSKLSHEYKELAE